MGGMEFSAILRRVMSEARLSPTELINRSGLSRQTIYTMLGGGAKNVKLTTIDKLADALAIDVHGRKEVERERARRIWSELVHASLSGEEPRSIPMRDPDAEAFELTTWKRERDLLYSDMHELAHTLERLQIALEDTVAVVKRVLGRPAIQKSHTGRFQVPEIDSDAGNVADTNPDDHDPSGPVAPGS